MAIPPGLPPAKPAMRRQPSKLQLVHLQESNPVYQAARAAIIAATSSTANTDLASQLGDSQEILQEKKALRDLHNQAEARNREGLHEVALAKALKGQLVVPSSKL